MAEATGRIQNRRTEEDGRNVRPDNAGMERLLFPRKV